MGRLSKKTLEQSIKEEIGRAVRNKEIKGTEKLKWVLAGIKFSAMEKMMGSTEHGSGFDTIDDTEEGADGDGESDAAGS